ncbi:hypothetical protein [Holospora obtusa]|uniref:hypothetical protein n=1 Tax=Holospora obtusa TaxID=49893 RepID=UPI0003AE8926|nr:hypothetical protein [Holospora obtusa]
MNDIELTLSPKNAFGCKAPYRTRGFYQYATNHPDARSEDIVREFGISASEARYWLKRVALVLKNLHLCGKQVIKYII